MASSNIIFQMPFDESAGSTKAYDYSTSRMDGDVVDADFVEGYSGKAINFDGNGHVDVAGNPISNIGSGDFTVTGYVQVNAIECGTPTQLIWLGFFKDSDECIEVASENIKPNTWYSIAAVRSGSRFSFYLNGALVKEVTMSGTLLGLSLNQDYYGSVYGLGKVDEVTIYDKAMTQTEVQDSLNGKGSEEKPLYQLDGVDFKDYGVYVSDSKGVVDRPKMKSPASVSWDDEHGDSVDLSHKFFEKRDITLSCFMKANNKVDFLLKANEFLKQFNEAGTNRVTINVHPTKPLIFEVYINDAVEITKKWSEKLMVGTFNLKLIEPEPVKRILKHYRTGTGDATCTITMTCSKYLNIYWGDGKVDYDVCGAIGVENNLSHTYEEDGEYYPVITGRIKDITDFETNALVVWDII